jgi:hypothetical protein
MMSLRKIVTGLALMAVLLGFTGVQVQAGAVFVSGHDPIWHAGIGSNKVGATNLALAGINFARDGSTDKFLFIESKTAPVPSGNARVAPFLTSALGFASSDFDHMEASELNALPDFAAALSSYSAIVVASDHGGMLTAAELGFLNSHSSDILNYINAGGGVAAFAESNQKGLITGETPFGFIPFLVSSAAFPDAETGNTVTAFGAGLGLVDSDVNGNFSHNLFTQTGGMTPVDLRNGNPDQILSLAFKGQFGNQGVLPEPGSLVLFGTALFGIGFIRRRRAG